MSIANTAFFLMFTKSWKSMSAIRCGPLNTATMLVSKAVKTEQFSDTTAHCHGYAGHKDEHHKHIWEQIDPPEWVGRSGWPHLNEVIEELQDWWEETGQHLDLSEGIGDAEDNDTPSQ